MEAVLVGEVVSHEDRDGALKRRLVHEGLDGRPLVEPWRPDLGHHVAELERLAVAPGHGLGGLLDRLGQFGGAAVVKGEAQDLVLKFHARVFQGERCRLDSRASQLGMWERPHHGAVSTAADQAMHSGDGGHGALDDPVDVLQRTAADNGDAAVRWRTSTGSSRAPWPPSPLCMA